MKRAVLLAVLSALLATCSKNGPLPVIGSFTVDNANPEFAAPITFSFSVTGATGISLFPVPGTVTASPVTVQAPPGTTTFTLEAVNHNGTASRRIDIVARGVQPLTIDSTDASPGQSPPGGPVTLSWTTSSSVDHAAVTGGELTEPLNGPANGSVVVHPAATTIYTLTAFNRPGHFPESVTAKITARVFAPPSVSGFAANPQAIVQGDASTLSWSGNAVSYSVSDGTTTLNVGPRRGLIVRPPATTTYTLTATGLGGALANPPQTIVTVTPHAGTTLAYIPPAAAPLQLVVADPPCSSPCGEVTLRIVASTTVPLRAFALNLPFDTTKVSFNPSSFSSTLPGAVAKATLGDGALHDTLVIGVARKGSGTAPASDVTLATGDELARFTLTLNSAGGTGIVFDGAALAAQPSSTFKAVVQGASGRVANAIAVGTLEAQ